MNLKSTIEDTIEITRQVGAMIRTERAALEKRGVEVKGKNDFVTHVDKASEQQLIEKLSKILPGSGFIAEEGTKPAKNEKYKWIIDPIDGTTNFIHGAPPYCISIGLSEGEQLIAGVVLEITANECFYAWDGSKAFLNETEIRVSQTPKLSGALLATGFPYTEFGRMDDFMKTMDYFFHHSHGVRRLGSAAADLAYVACGRYDGFYEYNLKPWDVAAGAYIVMAAGGRVTDFRGTNNFLHGGEVVAGNTLMFDEFREAVGLIMNKNE